MLCSLTNERKREKQIRHFSDSKCKMVRTRLIKNLKCVNKDLLEKENGNLSRWN